MEVMEELQLHTTAEAPTCNIEKDTDLVVSVTSESAENGDLRSEETGHSLSAVSVPEAPSEVVIPSMVHTSSLSSVEIVDSHPTQSADSETVQTNVAIQNPVDEINISITPVQDTQRDIENMDVESSEDPLQLDQTDARDSGIETEKVEFKTEVVVEQANNDTLLAQEQQVDVVEDSEHSNNILNELGQNIELSEVLRSSDTAENGENNSCVRQEMFNKEELLDILEGNDIATSAEDLTNLLQTKDRQTKKILETQIALNQLSRLKKTRKSQTVTTTSIRKKRGKHVITDPDIENKNEKNVSSESAKEDQTPEKLCLPEKSGHILDVLAKDWDDDEPTDAEPNKIPDGAQKPQNSRKDPMKVKEETTSQDCDKASSNQTIENQEKPELNKSGDEGQGQRRLGRVIKKKVIFDPDNPDTFTKSKVVTKHKEINSEKEEITTPSKKTKIDEKQRSKSKSPMSKMTWKKPIPKGNNKHNKRLTEVDKLLMDEGAVNMIYQLTPEAPKGKKNMKTKAEFIKKLQSSTPESKEMKFRERKKEREETKKHFGLKKRSSLSGSIKSPSVCDDFETQSADDSIIYRRHSSSSYSSTCMSPRRLSDVDMCAGTAHNITLVSQISNTNGEQVTDIFIANNADTPTNQIINKDDCLSIKEKLNSKLSQVLNKRKRESNKGDKVPKHNKKMTGTDLQLDEIKLEKSNTFKHIVVKYLNNLAIASIKDTEHGGTIEVLKELIQALKEFDGSKITSVTLLTSESGSLCSDLNMRPMLDVNMEKRTNYAFELAETMRLLLSTVAAHSKMVVSGVWGACSGVALPLLALSDVALASDDSTFAFGDTFPKPGISVFTTSSRKLSHKLVTDVVVWGHRISAGEAQAGGLVSRTLWPRRADAQLRAIAIDLAAQPKQSVLLKKKLLNLDKTSVSEAAFLQSLEKERDLMVQYWTSVEGQDMLRKHYQVE